MNFNSQQRNVFRKYSVISLHPDAMTSKDSNSVRVGIKGNPCVLLQDVHFQALGKSEVLQEINESLIRMNRTECLLILYFMVRFMLPTETE